MLCPLFKPKTFSPGDRVWYHSRTLGAHVLATVVEPSPNGPQFCHIQYIRPGGVPLFALEYLCNPHPQGGDRHALWGGISRGEEGTSLKQNVAKAFIVLGLGSCLRLWV